MKIEASDTTVVFVDLVGYSSKAVELEGHAGAPAIATLNAAIQNTISTAIEGCGAVRADTVVMTTGDGAILTFDDPNTAVKFGFQLKSATDARNARVTDEANHHHYRTGIATGEVAIDTDATEGNGLGGMAIIRAARLESKAPHDGILIDPETWHLLAENLTVEFEGPEDIPGKRDETFPAYRWGARHQNAASEPPQSASNMRDLKRGILDKIDDLALAAQIDRLGIRIGIPANQMPAAVLTVEERGLRLLEWAEAYGELDQLNKELVGLLGKISDSNT